MIKVNCGHIEVDGPNILIKTELATLFNYFATMKTFTQEELHSVVDDGFLTEEEIDQKIAENNKKRGISKEQAQEEEELVSALAQLAFLISQ